jgi:hypothetical protein
MIIWSGLGFLVAVFTFAACLLMQLALDKRFGEGYYSTHPWAIGVALVIGGLISAVVGLLLKLANDQDALDTPSADPAAYRPSRHSIFFVPMHWAGMLIALIGGGIAIYDKLK